MKSIIVLRLLILLFLHNSLWAQDIADTQTPGSPESVVSRLSDEEVRRLLLEKLNEDDARQNAGQAMMPKNSALACWRTI